MFCIPTSRRLAALSLAATAVVILPLAAFAAGSPSIANAPLVQPGVQQFGDNSTCCYMNDGFGFHREFWALRLVSGDRVTINWTFPQTGDSNVTPRFFTPAVTDFNFAGSDSAEAESAGAVNGKGSARLVAGASGRWTLAFVTSAIADDPTAYDFTYYVKHVARLHLAPLASISRTGRVSLSVRAPDGAAISNTALKVRLEGFWGRGWRLLATSTPKAGKASFRLRLAPALRGTTIKLRARAAGGSYLAATSQTRSVRVR